MRGRTHKKIRSLSLFMCPVM